MNNEEAKRILDGIISDAEKQENMPVLMDKFLKDEKVQPFCILFGDPMGGLKYLKALDAAKFIAANANEIVPDDPEDSDEEKENIDEWRKNEILVLQCCAVFSLLKEEKDMMRATSYMPSTYDYVVESFWKYKNGKTYGFDWIDGSAMKLLKDSLIFIDEWIDEGVAAK